MVGTISTGGTSRELKSAGLEVKDVSEVTGHPEVLMHVSKHYILPSIQDCCPEEEQEDQETPTS